MGYTGASQVQRVQVGSASQRYSVLGLNVSTDTGGSTYFTRDETGVLLGMRAPSGRYYYLYDGLGNVAAVTDSAGAVVASYRYSSYGETLSSTGTLSNPYRFGGSYGAYTDVGTGLIKIGQRFYDPALGRWTQQDPLGGGYVYAADSPVNLGDPTGLWYVDYNVTAGALLGLTGGMILDSNRPKPCLYGGLGLTTPGISGSMMWSPGSTGPGAYFAVGGGAGLGVSLGTSLPAGPNTGYAEVGGTWPPGAAAMVYLEGCIP